MNRFEFMGRLTKDVETRNTTSGTGVAVFTLAVNRKFTKQGEEKQSDFFSCTAFGKTAEHISKYFAKGQQVLVTGRIQNRSWEDTTGAKRYATDFIVEDTYFADSKRENNNEIKDEASYITIDDTLQDLPF